MEMLEALSDEKLQELIKKQRERVRTSQEDYWELAWEAAVRTVRKLLPEAAFLRLGPGIHRGELGLEAIYSQDGELLVDSEAMGEIGRRFWAIDKALVADGFFADYADCYGPQSQVSFFDLGKHTQIPSGRFEARFKTL
jgi:hypothetical protein